MPPIPSKPCASGGDAAASSRNGRPGPLEHCQAPHSTGTPGRVPERTRLPCNASKYAHRTRAQTFWGNWCGTDPNRSPGTEFAVPLCRVHHRELHRQGDERAWWNKFNIDPMPIALKFWQLTRGIPTGPKSTPEPENSAAKRTRRFESDGRISELPIVDIADATTQ